MTSILLTELFRYKAWANEELLASLASIDSSKHEAERRTALLIFNHAHTVDRIFALNVQRRCHAYIATGTPDPPAIGELSKAVSEIDRWYVDYVQALGANDLVETLEFTFTDRTAGRMTREEMLAHVITHSGYHRGEVGRILAQLSIPRPRDIFTGYLHKVEPSRRELLGRFAPAGLDTSAAIGR